jgi:hypothetical protein
LGQFVYQLVQISDLPRQWVVDVFHVIAADHASDEARIGIQPSLGKKCLKRHFFLDELLQLAVIKACQPLDDLVQFNATRRSLGKSRAKQESLVRREAASFGEAALGCEEYADKKN